MQKFQFLQLKKTCILHWHDFIMLQILPKGHEKTLGKKDQPPSPRFSGYMDQALTCLISESSLVLYGKLGNGSFGVVKKGDWTTPSGNKVTLYIFP